MHFLPQSLRTMPARPVDFGTKVSPLHAILRFCGDYDKAFNLAQNEESFLKFDQVTPTYGHIGEGNSGYREANAWLLDAIRGPQTALEQLPPAKRDWLAVVNAFQLCPLLIPSPAAAIDRTDEYTMERRNWFKREAVYKSVGDELSRWFSRFWNDLDVEQGPGAEDMKAVHDIVAHAGRILDGDLIYKKERQTKTVLDIGVLRYPDISCPFIKVYRIELVAWYESTTVGAYTRDKNGLMAKFNLRQYEPDQQAIEGMRMRWREAALNNLARQGAEAARQDAKTDGAGVLHADFRPHVPSGNDDRVPEARDKV